MREQDHKSLWCPMVRYVPARSFAFGRIGAAINRWLDNGEKALNPDPAKCIGSACAMWRWSQELKRQFIMPRSQNERLYYDRLTDEDPEPERPAYVPASYIWSPCDGDPAGWVEPEEEAQPRRQGFCGLAGKPLEE